MRWRVLLAALLCLPLLAGGARAEGCFPVASAEARLVPAALRTAALPAGATARLTFLGHASFLIESAEGVTAVTDFNGFVGAPLVPDIVTMNNAHDTHFTAAVPPGVTHVLRGWNPDGGEARHDLSLRDLRVRNVPTAVHGRAGDQTNSNSIFVFEIEDLCIAHLGHLHQAITDQILAELGVIDIVMVPIDGTWTMSQEEMLEAARRIGAPVVIPMHYFNQSVLQRFLALASEDHRVLVRDTPAITLSRTTLPQQRTVLVLPGG